MARAVHRPPAATFDRHGAGSQHRFAGGAAAHHGGRSDIESGTAGLSAIVQLRADGRCEQLRRCESRMDVQHSRHGELGGRYFQPPDQRQTAFACGFAAKRSLPRCGADATDSQCGRLLLSVAEPRRASRCHGARRGALPGASAHHAGVESGRQCQRSRRRPDRSDALCRRNIAVRSAQLDPANGKFADAFAGRHAAHDRTQQAGGAVGSGGTGHRRSAATFGPPSGYSPE